jgi:hypothetical protein
MFNINVSIYRLLKGPDHFTVLRTGKRLGKMLMYTEGGEGTKENMIHVMSIERVDKPT